MIMGPEEKQQENAADHNGLIEMTACQQGIHNCRGNNTYHTADQDQFFRFSSFIETEQDHH